MTRKKILSIAFCVSLPLIIGIFSGFVTRNEMGNGTWYQSLAKPSFNPPAFIFAPVWTILYLLMGISLFRIWNKKQDPNRKNGLIIFAVQLFFNFWWSILFFRYHLLQVSIIDIAILWVCILWMIILFKKIDPLAAYIQLPYLTWVSFATVLNAAIVYLNC